MSSRIIDQEDIARYKGRGTAAALRTAWADLLGQTIKIGTDVVLARIDAGRWVADCPYCTGAEAISKDTPVFFCFSCGMLIGSNKIRLPTLPVVATAEARVADLLMRERYWSPIASVVPITVRVSFPDVTPRHAAALTAAVTPIAAKTTLPAIAATWVYAVDAAMVPVTVTGITPGVTPGYASVLAAAVAPLAVDATLKAVTASSV